MSAHWAEAYVGMAYDKDNWNCGDLVMLVQREQFGREVALPVERKEYHWKELTSIISQEIPKQTVWVEVPQDGDVVLMNNGSFLKHVGVYVLYCGTPYVLHNLAKAGTCLHPISALGSGVLASLSIEGFYRIGQVGASATRP